MTWVNIIPGRENNHKDGPEDEIKLGSDQLRRKLRGGVRDKGARSCSILYAAEKNLNFTLNEMEGYQIV